MTQTIQSEFFKVCKSIDWQKNQSPESAKLNLVKLYSRETIELMRDFRDALKEQLDEAVNDYQTKQKTTLKIDNSDAYFDIAYEVISRGEDFINTVLSDPSILEKMYEEQDYVSSFWYCFPVEEEFDALYQQVEMLDIEKEYDALCKFINWGPQIDWKKMREKIKNAYSSEQIEQFNNYMAFMRGEIEGAIEQYESQNNRQLRLGSDDDLLDLIAEILSKGAKEIQTYIEHPELVEKMYVDGAFTESFFYCFD